VINWIQTGQGNWGDQKWCGRLFSRRKAEWMQHATNRNGVKRRKKKKPRMDGYTNRHKLYKIRLN
jgi:hypothetical protein